MKAPTKSRFVMFMNKWVKIFEEMSPLSSKRGLMIEEFEIETHNRGLDDKKFRAEFKSYGMTPMNLLAAWKDLQCHQETK